jgi:hypothetical protein
MKDTDFEHALTTDAPDYSATYQAGLRRIEADRHRREQRSYGAMVMAAGMAGGFHEKGKPGRIVVLARSFCILFAFLTPSLLLIRYVL